MKVIIVDTLGTTKSFESKAAAARFLEVNESSVRLAIRRGNLCKGFKVYVDEDVVNSFESLEQEVERVTYQSQDIPEGKHLCISDLHIPFVNQTLLLKVVKMMQSNSFVGLHILGDFLDMSSLSKYDLTKVNKGVSLSDEYIIGNFWLDILCEYLDKDAYKTYVQGNHECFDSETEILTDSGWMLGTQLTGSENVGTLNMRTGAIEYQIPSSLTKRVHNGDMYKLHNYNVDLLVTPGHRLLHTEGQRKVNTYNFTEAKDYKEGYRTNMYCSGVSTNPDYSNITDDEIKLLAWLITDGSVKLWKGNLASYIIYQSKLDNVEKIKELLTSCKLNFSHKSRQRDIKEICGKTLKTQSLPENMFFIGSTELTKISFHKEYTNKYIIPNFVKDFSKRQFDVFLNTLIDGDGSRHKSAPSAMMLYGVLDVLEQVQILCHCFGYKATLSKYRDKHYRLNITEKSVITVNGAAKANDFSKTSYSGEVWCATVPNDTLVVRRSGKVSIQGNCRFNKYMQSSEAAKLGNALLSPTTALNLVNRGFVVEEIYPDGYIQLGDIQLIHGIYINSNHPKTHIQKLRSSCMYGHTHQQLIYSENGLTAYNIGFLADRNAPIFSYSNRFEKANWREGFAVINYHDGTTYVEMIECKDNGFIYNNKLY